MAEENTGSSAAVVGDGKKRRARSASEFVALLDVTPSDASDSRASYTECAYGKTIKGCLQQVQASGVTGNVVIVSVRRKLLLETKTVTSVKVLKAN